MKKVLMGSYSYSIDEKGRVVVPSKFRDIVGTTVFVTLGFDKCIAIYSEEEYDALSNIVSSKSVFDPKARDFKRIFFGNTNEVEIDKQGRVVLSKLLMAKVGITKEVYINGAFDHLEIWDKDAFERRELEQIEHYEENAASYCNPLGE